MTEIHIDCCPVCKKKDFSTPMSCKDYLVSGKSFSIIQCKSCQFSFTQDFPSEKEIGKYYEASDYISHSDTHNGIINKLYHLVRKISLNSKVKLIRKASAKSSSKLLDIGAGTGYFLNKAKNAGWNVIGIEKSEVARQQTKSKFGIDCFGSDYLSDIPTESIDVVTMWHVLEHIENLNETMQLIHSVLTSDGIAVIALPNKKSTDANHYKQDWAAYDVPRHLWHFSPSDFKLLADNNGFLLSQIRPMYFDGFYISMLSEQNKGRKGASIIGLIKGGFFFLRSLTDRKKSSSIIYILRKK